MFTSLSLLLSRSLYMNCFTGFSTCEVGPRRGNGSSGEYGGSWEGEIPFDNFLHVSYYSVMTTRAQKDAEARKARPHKGQGKPVVWHTLLADVRKSHGLTLKDVAIGARLSESLVFYAECGAEIKLGTARALADYFGKSIEELWPKRV